MSNETELASLLKMEERIRNELRDIKVAVRSATLKVIKDRYALEAGTVVMHNGHEYRVTHISTKWKNKPWLEGNIKKKDGTWGTQKRNLFDEWEVIKSTEGEA